MDGHDRLRTFTGSDIRPERHRASRAVSMDVELERSAGVPVPGLGGIDAVPMGTLPAREQEIDRGRSRAPALDRARIAEGLPEMSAFGMRREVQQADHLGGSEELGQLIAHLVL